MLNHSLTRIENSRPMPLHPEYLAQDGVPHIVEGMAMINSIYEGIGRVRPSTAAAADGSFIGLSAEINRRQATVVAVQEITVPAAAPYTVILSNPAIGPATGAPPITAIRTIDRTVTGSGASLSVSGGTRMFANAAVAVTSAAAASANIKWGTAADGTNPTGADRANLVFDFSHAGDTFTIIYRYSPTLEQGYALFGDGNVQGAASPGDAAQVMTVITHGLVFTDQFDTGTFWHGADRTTIYTVANGLFAGTGGEEIPAGRVQVVQAPSVTVPFLGLLLL